MAERADGPNSHACGTSVMPPAFSASRAGVTPEASGHGSSGTFGNQMKRTVKIVAAVVLISIGLFVTYFGFEYARLVLTGSVSTSGNAHPSDVNFVELPPDSKKIRYWDHWHNRIAVFETTEAAFRKVFPTIPFSEIQRSVTYYADGFGDPANAPWLADNNTYTTSDGLLYEKIEDNGGGERIYYDRITHTAYYYYSAW